MLGLEGINSELHDSFEIYCMIKACTVNCDQTIFASLIELENAPEKAFDIACREARNSSVQLGKLRIARSPTIAGSTHCSIVLFPAVARASWDRYLRRKLRHRSDKGIM